MLSSLRPDVSDLFNTLSIIVSSSQSKSNTNLKVVIGSTNLLQTSKFS